MCPIRVMHSYQSTNPPVCLSHRQSAKGMCSSRPKRQNPRGVLPAAGVLLFAFLLRPSASSRKIEGSPSAQGLPADTAEYHRLIWGSPLVAMCCALVWWLPTEGPHGEYGWLFKILSLPMGTGDLPPPQISIWGHRRVLFPHKEKTAKAIAFAVLQHRITGWVSCGSDCR